MFNNAEIESDNHVKITERFLQCGDLSCRCGISHDKKMHFSLKFKLNFQL